MHRILASLIALVLPGGPRPARAQRPSLPSTHLDPGAAADHAATAVLALPAMRDIGSEPAVWAPPGLTCGEEPRAGRPPLAPGRVTGRLVAGATFGGVFALAGLTAG